MFDCPACSANLRFDPATQDLSCAYCGNHYDVHAFDENKGNAEDTEFFETTVYTCPQCGGELIGEDNEAAVFCSYCGASNVLDGKLRKEKRPKMIIPFQVTKDDCKKKFIAAVKKTGFAPKELMDPEIIDSFRGIYMPYWSYSVEQNTDLMVKSEKSHQKGDYLITEKYVTNGTLNASYKGYAKDSSSTFYDEISDSIAPYDESQSVPFTPAYMSGFYADVSDVDEKVYETDAKQLAIRESLKRVYKKVQSQPGFQGSLKKDIPDASLHTRVTDVRNVMYPVWFFSYRNGDRISYGAVNGQTGKVMADVPISKRKYYLTSFLMMIPIFLILNMFLTLTPKWALGISIGLDVIAFIMMCVTKNEIEERASMVKDLGYQSQKTHQMNPSSEDGKVREAKISLIDILLILIAFAGVAVLFISPVSDIWYYGTTLLVLIFILLEILSLIHIFNLRATHKLPQFKRTGGDDRA